MDHTPTLTEATSIQNYVNNDLVCVQKRLSQHKQVMKLKLAGIACRSINTPNEINEDNHQDRSEALNFPTVLMAHFLLHHCHTSAPPTLHWCPSHFTLVPLPLLLWCLFHCHTSAPPTLHRCPSHFYTSAPPTLHWCPSHLYTAVFPLSPLMLHTYMHPTCGCTDVPHRLIYKFVRLPPFQEDMCHR